MDPSSPLKLEYRLEETGEVARLLHVTLPSMTMQELYQETTLEVQSDPGQSVDRLLEGKVEQLLFRCYRQIISETQLEVLGTPELNVLQLGMSTPLEFTAEIKVMPPITLKPYEEIGVNPSGTEQDVVQQAIIDTVVDHAEVSVPLELIDQEIEAMWLAEQGHQMQHLPEAVRRMSLRNWSQDGEMQQTAAKRVKTLLVLMKIAHQEGLVLSDEELLGYLHQLAEKEGPDWLQQVLADPMLQQQLADQILLTKIADFLQSRVAISPSF